MSSQISKTGVTVTINEAKQGVEIRFPVKPGEGVLATIKANGFKWGKFNKCWYKKLSNGALRAANDIAGIDEAILSNNDGAGAMVEANEDAGYSDWLRANGV